MFIYLLSYFLSYAPSWNGDNFHSCLVSSCKRRFLMTLMPINCF